MVVWSTDVINLQVFYPALEFCCMLFSLLFPLLGGMEITILSDGGGNHLGKLGSGWRVGRTGTQDAAFETGERRYSVLLPPFTVPDILQFTHYYTAYLPATA